MAGLIWKKHLGFPSLPILCHALGLKLVEVERGFYDFAEATAAAGVGCRPIPELNTMLPRCFYEAAPKLVRDESWHTSLVIVGRNLPICF